MKSFFSNLNQWTRKIHRWMVIPVALILIANILLLGTPNGRTIQRIQQTTVLFMFVTGLYLYLYRQWSILQRKKRNANKNT